MHRTYLAFIITFLLPLSVSASVRITEVAWMGIAGDSGQFGEWIELHNDGASEISLAGWKLYGDGGSQLIFTLSHTIPAGGYLLIERTTASMPDPVPGVDDESGSFGGGGLSNDGEHIVLKDSAGEEVESFNYSSGWPAGSAATRETMQRSGSGWVTGAATPKGPTADSGGGSGSQTTEVTQTTSSSSSKHEPVRHDAYLAIDAPTALYQYVDHIFTATIVLEDGLRHKSGSITWNMGDGTSFTQKKLEPVVHQYRYPGVYTVWVGYFKNSFADEPYLQATKTIKVGSPEIAIAKVGTTAVELTNQSGSVVDLSGWHVVSDGAYRALPPHTLLAADASITISAKTLGLSSIGSVRLARPGKELLPLVASAAIAAPAVKTVQAREETIQAVPLDDELIAREEAPPTRNRTKRIIFGAVALTVLALCILLERFMAKRE